MVDGTPDESVAVAGSSISTTRLAVRVRRGTSWAAQSGSPAATVPWEDMQYQLDGATEGQQRTTGPDHSRPREHFHAHEQGE
uniref:Uncharacterized protein n=1 Tax=Tanacetum cinerariifolium TaxID=118510 RepID=A0A699TFM4_TANCI|nr:hypothetical protein [Tanacetum cinerariifolium]